MPVPYTQEARAMAANNRNSNTRKTTAVARRAAAPAPVEPDLDDYEDDTESMSAAEAQEQEATQQHITVSLCGEPVRVVPATAWRVSTQRRLRFGDLDGFVADVLHEDDYELYEELDPTAEEFRQFVVDAQELSGEGSGKSRGPNRSSRRTRRR
ncbi:hypothetical protein ACIQVR_40805 [Streptomyces xanthochromogenes]|uniref:hypothetical protein n=1 Tax=Streptomyces xanthochromogenes TaxID=67384 RepID=UPI00381E4670